MIAAGHTRGADWGPPLLFTGALTAALFFNGVQLGFFALSQVLLVGWTGTCCCAAMMA